MVNTKSFIGKVLLRIKQKFELSYTLCRVMMTKGMVFRYMWVYSKEDTMAHTRRPVVTSKLMARSAYKTLYKVLMNINDSGCWPYGLASTLIVIGVSA